MAAKEIDSVKTKRSTPVSDDKPSTAQPTEPPPVVQLPIPTHANLPESSPVNKPDPPRVTPSRPIKSMGRPEWMLQPEEIQRLGRPPEVDLTDSTKWQFWEWFAGSGVLTSTLSYHSVATGIPIDYNTGWNIQRRDHQKTLLHLVHKHNPEILWL